MSKKLDEKSLNKLSKEIDNLLRKIDKTSSLSRRDKKYLEKYKEDDKEDNKYYFNVKIFIENTILYIHEKYKESDKKRWIKVTEELIDKISKYIKDLDFKYPNKNIKFKNMPEEISNLIKEAIGEKKFNEFEGDFETEDEEESEEEEEDGLKDRFGGPEGGDLGEEPGGETPEPSPGEEEEEGEEEGEI